MVFASVMATAGQAWASGPMLTGGLTSQPIGHYEFCRTAPAECSMRLRDDGPERMSGALWSAIVNVNGDCEDYVLEKRRKLRKLGLSLSNLLVTVVRKPDGEGHAVLTVRTDKGDFVLDNLSGSVRDWSQTGYRYLKRQASNHTGRWVTIREGSAPLVAAVH